MSKVNKVDLSAYVPKDEYLKLLQQSILNCVYHNLQNNTIDLSAEVFELPNVDINVVIVVLEKNGYTKNQIRRLKELWIKN